VVQADSYNASDLNTVLVAVVTSNKRLAAMPGNVFLPSTSSDLPSDSVVNVTALVTLNKDDLAEFVGEIPAVFLNEVHRGLRRVLDL
jgi:mRNA interferase MazF